mmetsp:Transcript_7595/g.32118  ORF Transcript_7595/g.32118 Transcript_7595/m.32118 type:complete len:356 (+) Transcript_7595:237-1304(+)
MVMNGLERLVRDGAVGEGADAELHGGEDLPLELLHRQEPRDEAFAGDVSNVCYGDRQLRYGVVHCAAVLLPCSQHLPPETGLHNEWRHRKALVQLLLWIAEGLQPHLPARLREGDRRRHPEHLQRRRHHNRRLERLRLLVPVHCPQRSVLLAQHLSCFCIRPHDSAAVENCLERCDHVRDPVHRNDLLAVRVHDLDAQVRHATQHCRHAGEVLLEELFVDGHGGAEAADAVLQMGVELVVEELHVVEHEQLSAPLRNDGECGAVGLAERLAGFVGAVVAPSAVEDCQDTVDVLLHVEEVRQAAEHELLLVGDFVVVARRNDRGNVRRGGRGPFLHSVTVLLNTEIELSHVSRQLH